jgi:hypothetical protein
MASFKLWKRSKPRALKRSKVLIARGRLSPWQQATTGLNEHDDDSTEIGKKTPTIENRRRLRGLSPDSVEIISSEAHLTS